MDRYGGTKTTLTIALHGGIYLANKIHRYVRRKIPLKYSLAWRTLLSYYNRPFRESKNALTIDMPVGLYLAIIMDRYTGLQTPLNIALPVGLYIAIIMERYGGPKTAVTID
jgi:hypothetical protein